MIKTDASYLVAGTADDGGEDGAGRVIAGESGLAHAGAVVNYQGGYLVVTHDAAGGLK